MSLRYRLRVLLALRRKNHRHLRPSLFLRVSRSACRQGEVRLPTLLHPHHDLLHHVREEFVRHGMQAIVTLTHRNVCKDGFTVENLVDSGRFPSFTPHTHFPSFSPSSSLPRPPCTLGRHRVREKSIAGTYPPPPSHPHQTPIRVDRSRKTARRAYVASVRAWNKSCVP